MCTISVVQIDFHANDLVGVVDGAASAPEVVSHIDSDASYAWSFLNRIYPGGLKLPSKTLPSSGSRFKRGQLCQASW